MHEVSPDQQPAFQADMGDINEATRCTAVALLQDGVEVGVTGVFVGMGKGVSVDDRSWTGPVAVGEGMIVTG